MTNELVEKKEALEEIYLTLAEFFKYPTKEFYHELHDGLIEKRFEELTEFIGYSIPQVSFQKRFETFDQMKQLYVRCFMGVEQPYAPPVESIYKVWTADPTSSLSIAKSKGYFYGDPALHLKHLYEQFQLELPEEYNNIPDHLTLLLEFLTFLILEGTNQQVNQLILDHFNWLEDFRTELAKVDYNGFFLDVTDIVISMIQQEKERSESIA